MFETTTFKIKPQIHFVSSSAGEAPASGSAYIAPIKSKCVRSIKSEDAPTAAGNSPFDESDYRLLDALSSAKAHTVANASTYSTTGVDISGFMSVYLNSSNQSPVGARFHKFLDMFRFDAPTKFNLNHVVKRNLNNILYPYHQVRYPESGKHYTNYNCLNFFTASELPDTSCLIYPNKDDVYTPNAGFNLDFWINPRYDNEVFGADFHAGTIFHMSSSIAVSLVSGSKRDEFNLVDDFKLILQLSQSADLNPSSIDVSSINSNSNLIFSSSFCLRKNNWHHVSIGWDPKTNNSSGSISIDGVSEDFYLPSGSISTSGNSVVCIGNYFDSNVDNAKKLFNASAASSQGLTQLDSSTTNPSTTNIFKNPLNAEVTDIKLFNRSLNRYEIEKLSTQGVNQIIVTKEGCKVSERSLYDDLLFYVPVFFYPETREREVIETPFKKTTMTTNSPFNLSYSFGLGGKLINLENFTREFIKGEFPRLQSLTGSNSLATSITADQHVYHTGSLTKRNLTVLPCDNGLFYPDYHCLSISPMSASLKYAKSGDIVDYSRINLDDLIPGETILKGIVHQIGTIFSSIFNFPDLANQGPTQKVKTQIAQRLRDRSSNETVIFDISNLYYGNKITEKSFEIIDKNLTGSQGKIKIKIKDNGEGSLYRADCETKQATWNNIGDIFYHEGMAVIKTPHLPYFAKDKTEIKLKGDHNIHTMILNVPCEQGQINSSSNKTYVENPPTNAVSDEDLSTVYVSTVNIHDDNFNIIMKANFSQPIPKTEEDEFVIRLKKDF